MAGAPIVVPFDFEPESVDVKTNTSNEAIASGKYAYVVAEVRAGSFYINDEIALEGDDSIVDAVVNNPGGAAPGPAIFTCPAGRSAKVIFQCISGSDQYLVFDGETPGVEMPLVQNPDTAGGTAFRSYEMILGPGDAIHARASGQNAHVVGYYLNEPAPKTIGFWVPENTNLKVSGNAQYTVALFNQKT